MNTTRSVTVEVDLEDFDDDTIFEYAKTLGYGGHTMDLATRALELFKVGNEAEAVKICRDLVEEITGRII